MDIIDQKIVISDIELLNIYGGGESISATLLNAIIRGLNTLYELGRSLGSTIRRIREDKLCEIS